MAKTRVCSRRNFLKRAAALAAGPLILPRSVLGGPGRTAPSDRVTAAYIGLGGWGFGGHLQEDPHRGDLEILAVCDVMRDRRARAKKKVEEVYAQNDRPCRVQEHRDFREVLDRPDIDGVVIATLHYWHAVMGILAAQAGKHVYVEKMCATTLGEARALSAAVKRHGVVFQHGTQGRSMPSFRHAAALVQAGRIGKVERIFVSFLFGSLTPGGPQAPLGAPTSSAPAVPVPEGFDWDLYLGPCPWKPYTGDLELGGVRFDALGDYTIHSVDSVQMILNAVGPVAVCPGGLHGARDMTITYADGTTLVPEEESRTDANFRLRLLGRKGAIDVGRDGCRVDPPDLDLDPLTPQDWRFNPNPADSVQSVVSRVVASNTRRGPPDRGTHGGLGLHKSNWFHCIRTGQRTNAHEDHARRSTSISILVHMTLALGRPLRWDPEKEEILGDEEANRLLDYPKRAPWQVY